MTNSKRNSLFIKILKAIWDNNFLVYLLLISILGCVLYLSRPNVHSQKDVIEINGTISQVKQVLVYGKKIKKTERDSTYHLYLNEYPCYIQVSYSHFNRKDFYKNVKYGDEVKVHIAKQDLKDLKKPNKRVRSFSLYVNSFTYLALDEGLQGFGKGYFEGAMIILPLLTIIIILRKKII